MGFRLNLSQSFSHFSQKTRQFKMNTSRRNSNAAALEASKTGVWFSLAVTRIMAIICTYLLLQSEPQLAESFGGQCVGGMCHAQIAEDDFSAWGASTASPAPMPSKSAPTSQAAPAPAMAPKCENHGVAPAPAMAPKDL